MSVRASECVWVWVIACVSEWVSEWVWVWVCVWVWVSECACCLLLKNVSDVLNEHSCIVSLHTLLLILTNLNENSCILSLACCSEVLISSSIWPWMISFLNLRSRSFFLSKTKLSIFFFANSRSNHWDISRKYNAHFCVLDHKQDCAVN